MSIPFADLIVAADELIKENASAAVEYDIDNLAYTLAVRKDIPKWFAREALLQAYKKKGSESGSHS